MVKLYPEGGAETIGRVLLLRKCKKVHLILKSVYGKIKMAVSVSQVLGFQFKGEIYGISGNQENGNGKGRSLYRHDK